MMKRICKLSLLIVFLLSLSIVPSYAENVIPVQHISGVPTHIEAGERVTLKGTVEPTHATYQTITWTVKDTGGTGAKISGNILRVPVGGNVVITATINDGVSIGKSYKQDFSIRVEKNDVEKLAMASAAVKSALDNYTVTNTTTKQDITKLVETTIVNTGVTRVSMSWSNNNDFSKTNATTSSIGHIIGQIDLICNMRFSSITLNKTIAMLPKVNTPIKEEPKVEDKVVTNPKVEITNPTTPEKPIEKEVSKPKKDTYYPQVEQVIINDKPVDKSQYTVNKDTGEIVFKEEFVKELPKGEKNITIKSADGETITAHVSDDTGVLTLDEKQSHETPTNISYKKEDKQKESSQIIVPLFTGIVTVSGLAILYFVKKGAI